MSSTPLNDAPEHVPTYDGEIAAIEDIEAHGWTVWHHCCGFGHFTDATAIHPTNPASPMRLTHFEKPNPARRPPFTLLLWWWRPMHQIPVTPSRGSPWRLDTYMPARTARVHREERTP